MRVIAHDKGSRLDTTSKLVYLFCFLFFYLFVVGFLSKWFSSFILRCYRSISSTEFLGRVYIACALAVALLRPATEKRIPIRQLDCRA